MRPHREPGLRRDEWGPDRRLRPRGWAVVLQAVSAGASLEAVRRRRLDTASAPRATRPAQGSLAADIEPRLRQGPDPCLSHPYESNRSACAPCTVVRPWWVRSSLTIAPHVDIIGRIRAPRWLRGRIRLDRPTETGASCPGVEVLTAGRRPKNQAPSGLEAHVVGRRGARGVRALTERAGTVVAARGRRPWDACARDGRERSADPASTPYLRAPQGGIE